MTADSEAPAPATTSDTPQAPGSLDAKEGRAQGTLVSGTFWISLSEGATALLGVLTSVVAARLVPPSQFGMMAVVTLAIAVLETFTTSGFDEALVQRRGNIDEFLDSVWSWNVLRGLLFVLVLAAAGPILARVYDEPALAWVTLAAAPYAILQGLRNVGTVAYQRDLHFRRIFAMNVAQAGLTLLIYLPAVIWLRDVRALIVGYLATALAGVLVSYAAHPFRPRFRPSLSKLRELVRFGKWVTGMSVVGFVVTRGDDLFISKYLGLTALAYYQLAYSLSNLPATHVTHVLARASFPAYSRLQHDPAAMRSTFVDVSRATVLLSAPLAVLLWCIAPELVTHVLGPRWQPVAPLIRILVLAGFLRSFAALAGYYFYAAGRPDLNFRMNLPRLFVTVILIWPLSAAYGMKGACWTIVLAIASGLPIWFSGMRRLAQITVGEVLRHHMLALLASGLLAAILLPTRPLFAGLGGPIGALAWLVLGLLAWVGALLLLGRLTPWSVATEFQRLRAAARKKATDAAL